MEYIRTGEIKMADGLVDYVADGYIERGGDRIPCQIGYIEYIDMNDEIHCEAEYIFIKDGITANGNHYYAETIKI